MTAKKKRWLVAGVSLAAILGIVPSYVRAFRVVGASDAPSFLVGDRIVVNRAAYDLRLPYTKIAVLSHSAPERGDVVMFRSPGKEYAVFKRVIGCPGDRVEMRDYHLRINGREVQYEPVDERQFRSIASRNELGAIVEMETLDGRSHFMAYDPRASDHASFEPVLLPERHYFVLGDNRSNSEDSRTYGAISRDSIQGRVFRLSR